MTYTGTVMISVVALYQSERANIINERTTELASQAYRVSFQFAMVDYKKKRAEVYHPDQLWDKDIKEYLFFCEAEKDHQDLEAYKIAIKNYSLYPITQIDITGSGFNETEQHTKELHREMSPFIESKEQHIFAIEYPSEYVNRTDKDTYEITCTNIYGFSMTIRLTIHRIEENGKMRVGYSQTLLAETKGK